MQAEPEEAHRWLEQLLGDWQMPWPAGEASAGDPWREHVRSLEGLWIVCEGQGTVPGGRPGQTLMTLGYNPQTRRFVGTWVGSMMTHMWVYDGELEPDGKSLSLYCDGPDFETPGKVARYRDVITLIDHAHRRLTAQVQSPDGSWKDMMTMEYTRRD